MIINISIHDHRFDIRHWAQNPELHVGPFHNLIRFLNAVNTLHCLISLSSEFHKTGDKYDRLFFPYSIVLNRVVWCKADEKNGWWLLNILYGLS